MSKEELNEIIYSYKWIKVKKHTPWVSGTEGQKYKELEEHHIEETEFLISKCKELAKELLDNEEAISFYKKRVIDCDYPKEWSWVGFDYYNGYQCASEKYFKIIQQKEKEIEILKNKYEKKNKD